MRFPAFSPSGFCATRPSLQGQMCFEHGIALKRRCRVASLADGVDDLLELMDASRPVLPIARVILASCIVHSQ